jgi:hypothetical protein
MDTVKSNTEPMDLGDAVLDLVEHAKLDTREKIEAVRLIRAARRKEREEENKRLQEVLANQAKIMTEQKKFCERWDAAHKETETWKSAAKRAVKQFLSSVGWLVLIAGCAEVVYL